MNWYVQGLKKYAVFSGRARRAEYWWFVAFNTVIVFVFALIDVFSGLYSEQYSIGVFSGICSLAVFVPSLAVTIRRLHDTGRSGWWMLVGLIPVIGPIILLVFTILGGEPGRNKYGENPKEIGSV